MNKKFLEENDLLESYNRFARIANVKEYSFASNDKELLLDEDEEEDQQETSDIQNTQEPSLGGDNTNQSPVDNQSDVESLDSIPDETSETPEINDVPEQGIEEPLDSEQVSDVESEDDVVIDVTDLTKNSEETEQNIISLDNKLDDMLNQLSLKVDSVLTNSTQAMEELKREMEKRNPTNIEKLQMRTVQNYPFSTTPDQFWEKKEKEGVYDTKPEEYVLKTSDVNTNMSNNQFRQSLYTEELNYSTKLSDLL